MPKQQLMSRLCRYLSRRVYRYASNGCVENDPYVIHKYSRRTTAEKVQSEDNEVCYHKFMRISRNRKKISPHADQREAAKKKLMALVKSPTLDFLSKATKTLPAVEWFVV